MGNSDVIVTDPRFPRLCEADGCERVLSSHPSEKNHRALQHDIYKRRGKPLHSLDDDTGRYFRCNNCYARIRQSKSLRSGGTRCHSCGLNPSNKYGKGPAKNIH